MNPRNYSYMDVSALDGVRERLAAGDAALVLSTALDEVIWANGPGAALFGHTGIASLVGNDPELSAAAQRQISATPGYPAIGTGRSIAVRLAKGVSSQTVMFSASAVVLPDGEHAILLSLPDPLADKRSDAEKAARAISGLAANGGAVALVDAAGGVKAASNGFDALGIEDGVIAALAAEVADETDRMVKRPIATANGPLPAGIVRLADEPALSLVMIADDGEAEATDDVGVVAPDSAEDEIAAAGVDADDTSAEPDTTDLPDDDSADTADTQDDDPGEIVEPGNRAAAGNGSSSDDRWYFTREDKTASTEAPDSHAGEQAASDVAEPNDEAASSEVMGSPSDVAAAPVRFVWRTDAEGRFSALSEEFRSAFGPQASDVVGREFSDVSKAFNLDPDGEIAGLLQRRDTWSGRSVLWPITGTDLVAPVDLAALPVYSRDGTFEGFRGFGIARMGDAVVDADARGLALTGELPEADDSEADAGEETIVAPDDFAAEPDAEEDPFQGEVPALAIQGAAEPRESDKVISLAERRNPQPVRVLSSSEQQNFQEIGKRLKEADADVASEEKPAVAEDGAQAADTDETSGTTEATSDGETDQETQADETEVAEGPSKQADDASADVDGSDGIQTAEADSSEATGDVDAAENDAAAEETATEEHKALGEATAGESDGDEAAAAVADGTGLEGDVEDVAEEPTPAEPTAATEAGQTRNRDATRAPVGLSAFMPSAFATGGAADAALGVDSAVLSRLPLPLIIHAGDELHYANREFLNLTGYRSLAELDLAGGLDAIFADPYAADGASDQRVRLRTRDGTEFPVHAFLQSIGWQGGKGLLLALRRAEGGGPAADAADLEARLAELRTIIDTATDGVVIMDNDGNVRSVSRPAEALFGYNGDEITGKPFTSLFAIESQRPAREYLDGLAGNGVASVLNDGREVIGREAQGRFIPLFMTIGRLPGDSGFCAVLRDITHWKRAEEELTEARSAAERASSQKTEFLARVSHEIRTPLNAIIGFSELMIDEKFGPIGSDRYRDYLRDINRSGNHVLDLVNDLLDISKIEAGQQELSYEAVSLNDVLGEAVAMMQPQANRERVIIRSSLASKLPEVVADLRSIRQIALNLLSNAIRYTPAGGQVIVSTVYEAAGDIAMRVRDTGIGMAAAEIEQALKPFKQVNALKRPRGDGTGLGLPLTKAMVEANRARFAIQSTPGEGTLVEIIFPSQRVLAD
ncbi:MAG: PAS domain S-box protein [Rhizobiaceae bacterium]|nr:PAS domain S-box protein [Rhizobiaceae bacterium]